MGLLIMMGNSDRECRSQFAVDHAVMYWTFGLEQRERAKQRYHTGGIYNYSSFCFKLYVGTAESLPNPTYIRQCLLIVGVNGREGTLL